MAESEDEGAGLFITTADDFSPGAEGGGRLGESTDDNFGPGTGQGLFYAENS